MKKLYKVLSPIGFSGRREIGETIELTDEEAKSIGSDYIEPIEVNVEVAPEAISATADENVEAKAPVKAKGSRKK